MPPQEKMPPSEKKCPPQKDDAPPILGGRNLTFLRGAFLSRIMPPSRKNVAPPKKKRCPPQDGGRKRQILAFSVKIDVFSPKKRLPPPRWGAKWSKSAAGAKKLTFCSQNGGRNDPTLGGRNFRLKNAPLKRDFSGGNAPPKMGWAISIFNQDFGFRLIMPPPLGCKIS